MPGPAAYGADLLPVDDPGGGEVTAEWGRRDLFIVHPWHRVRH